MLPGQFTSTLAFELPVHLPPISLGYGKGKYGFPHWDIEHSSEIALIP